MIVGSKGWLKARRSGIGGSDAAAVLGLNGYSSPLDIWQQKVGLASDVIESEAMEWGSALEATIRRIYKRRNKNHEVFPGLPFYRDPDHPCMYANVDGLIDQDGVLEIKTSGFEGAEWADGHVPDRYYCQTQHYLSVHSRQWADIAVLFGGKGGFHMEQYRVERDQDFIQMLQKSELRFWKLVESETMPDLINHPAEKDALGRQWAGREKESYLVADADMRALAEHLRMVREELGELDDEKAALENKIKARMGEHIGIQLDANETITWKTDSKGKLSWKSIAESFEPNHETIESHRGTPGRTFRVPRSWSTGDGN